MLNKNYDRAACGKPFGIKKEENTLTVVHVVTGIHIVTGAFFIFCMKMSNTDQSQKSPANEMLCSYW